MVFLCDKFSVDGYSDLMEDKIASRFKQYLKDTTNKLQLSLQPMTTKKERETLMKIAECKSRIDIDNLLAIFYAQRSMDPKQPVNIQNCEKPKTVYVKEVPNNQMQWFTEM